MSNHDQFSNNFELLTQIVDPILAWYDQNARILPWRENTEPYRVWVSEIMLQQTRVEAVKPYFERFMQELPTIQNLADAEEAVLLKLWEGLGYYARVRNLQKAAQIICTKFHGVFPNTFEEIRSLPGIGDYTAGAVASISFGLPTPAVDGNVLRVITRLTENYLDIKSIALKNQITKELERIYPASRCGDFTQSLMELGAVVCTPNGFPKCEYCPLMSLCKAYQNQTQLLLPVKAKKESRRQESKTVFLLCYQDKIAVRKRQEGGLLSGLWEFPNADGILQSQDITTWLKDINLVADSITKSADKKHIFTHVEWKMSSYIINCTTTNADFLWVTKEELETQITLPTAFKKFLNCWPLYLTEK